MSMLIQVVAAFAGSLGFAIFFSMRGRQLVLASIGGALTWMVYLLTVPISGGVFIPYFVASIFVAVFAEIMARVNRAPATIFLTAAAVPLIPGGSLYYTMAGLVNQDEELFAKSGTAAVTIALAISLGLVAVAIVTKYVYMFIAAEKKKKL